MKKVMVFNFRTMQFEQATEAEEFMSLIESMNADCAAQQSMHLTGGESAANQALPTPEVSSAPKQNPVPPTRK